MFKPLLGSTQEKYGKFFNLILFLFKKTALQIKKFKLYIKYKIKKGSIKYDD